MSKYLVKKLMKHSLKALVLLSVIGASIPAQSAIPFRNAFEQMDLVNRDTLELNLSVLQKMHLEIESEQFSVANYVPYNQLNAGDDGFTVVRNIMKQSLKHFISGSNNNRTPFLRGAARVVDSLDSGISSSGHRMKFGINPIETKASFRYIGYLSATASYDVSDNEKGVEVAKSVNGKTYAYTYSSNDKEDKSILGVRWSF